MDFRIDGQLRHISFNLTDEGLARKIADLFTNTSPERYRGLYNMLRAASILEGDRFSLNDSEAGKFWKALSGLDGKATGLNKLPAVRGLQTAYISGKQAGRVFNQVAVAKKHQDYSIPIKAHFYGQKDTKVYFRIVSNPPPPRGEGAKDSPAADSWFTEGVTDKFGISRIDFFPPLPGHYQIFASTKKEDIEGVINYNSPQIATGTLTVITDRPTIAIDIVGLIHHYGFKTAAAFLKELHQNGYQLIGVTPYDDLHAQDRLSALLTEGGLSFVTMLHNSFRISDYYETDRGRAEFLAEYLKHMVAIRGVPLVAAVGLSQIAGKGFEFSGLFDPQDILVPEGVTLYGKEPLLLNKSSLTPILNHLLKNTERYQELVNTMAEGRNSDNYHDRMSWLMSKATATKFTDGNYFSYIRDEGPRPDHNQAAFEAFCNYIEKTGARGQILFETYAWHSDEQGLTIAMLLAEKAGQAKAEWDKSVVQQLDQLIDLAKAEGNYKLADRLGKIRKRLHLLGQADLAGKPKWGKMANLYRKLIKKAIGHPGDKKLLEKRKKLFHIVTQQIEKLKVAGPAPDIQKIAIDKIKKLKAGQINTSDIADGLEKLSTYVEKTPRVPIYLLVDKTALFQFAAPAGLHDGLLALEILKKSGAWLTVVPLDYGYIDKDGVVDPLYFRREPMDQIVPCKHIKLAVFQTETDGDKYKWVALGGGRFPGTKMMGSLAYRRSKEPHYLADFVGQSSGNFTDDTWVVEGEVVADIDKAIRYGIYNNRPVSEVKDKRMFIPPPESPPRQITAGDNRMWAILRHPWKGASTADVFWHMLWNNSPNGAQFTVVNGYSLHDHWMAEIKHLLFGGSAGASKKIDKKINIYTGGMKFVNDMLDRLKVEKLTQIVMWSRKLRKQAAAEGDTNFQDPINIYLIKAREFDPQTGRLIPPLMASNQQVHNRIYLLTGSKGEESKEECTFAATGNWNIDPMSKKDDEDLELFSEGTAVDQVKERVAEFKEQSVHVNAIPGITTPRADGSYMTEDEVYDFIFDQLNMNNPGRDSDSPTSQSFSTAFGRITSTALGVWWRKLFEQPTAIGVDTVYTPALLSGGGFENYQRLDVNIDLAKYYGMKMYYQILFGAAYIDQKYAGINLGLGVDSVISTPYQEWNNFAARWLGFDMTGSVLFSLKDTDVAGSIRIGATPMTLAIRPSWSKWEISLRPLQFGLLTHLADEASFPSAGLFIGSQLDIRWRNMPPLRDGDLYE